MQPLAMLVTPSLVTFCRLGRDGERLFISREAGDGNAVAEVWDVPARRRLFATSDKAYPELCWGWADASPDMKLVFTATPKGEDSTTLTLWDVASGRVVLSLPTGHAPLASTSRPGSAGILGVGLSADGTRLASGGFDDGTVRVYALRLEELVTLARQRLTRSLTDDECRRYLHLEGCLP